MIEVGRDEVGVAPGVLLGVDEALSKPTRDFLDDDRGVMLLLRKGFTGVTSSRTAVFTLGVVAALLLRIGRPLCEVFDDANVGAPARRGVIGVLAVRLLASAGFSGHEVCGVDRLVDMLASGSTRYEWAVDGV